MYFYYRTTNSHYGKDLTRSDYLTCALLSQRKASAIPIKCTPTINTTVHYGNSYVPTVCSVRTRRRVAWTHPRRVNCTARLKNENHFPKSFYEQRDANSISNHRSFSTHCILLSFSYSLWSPSFNCLALLVLTPFFLRA